MAAKNDSTTTIADVPSIEVDEFQRKIKQARQLALMLSLSPEALADGAEPENLSAVLSVLSDLLEDIEQMSRPVIDGVVLFKRRLAAAEPAHG